MFVNLLYSTLILIIGAAGMAALLLYRYHQIQQQKTAVFLLARHKKQL